MQERSAGMVLFRGSPPLFLILQYAYRKRFWDFPKGNIERGETEEQAALRELKEETGITDAGIIPGFREVIRYFYQREGKTVHKTVVDFLAETRTAEVTLSPEHVDFTWLPYRQALERLTYDNARAELKKAMEFLKKRNLAGFT